MNNFFYSRKLLTKVPRRKVSMVGTKQFGSVKKL